MILNVVVELDVVAVTVGRAGSAVGAGVGEAAVGVAAGGVVAVGAVEVAVGAGSDVEVGSEVAVGVGSGVGVGDADGCVAGAVGVPAMGSVAGTVVATACGGGGASSDVQASNSAASTTMTARNVLNSVTPWDALGSRANGGNCPTRPAHRQ